jgi:alkylation response protein AidB-like acyl-CoA dehydrogenase
MTEPGVAPSNMELAGVAEDGEVALNGRKWWSTALGHPPRPVGSA